MKYKADNYFMCLYWEKWTHKLTTMPQKMSVKIFKHMTSSEVSIWGIFYVYKKLSL